MNQQVQKKLVVATTNAGKAREIRHALQHLPVEILSLQDFPPLTEAVEDANTFMGNAEKKARHYGAATKCAVIADDSGLCVEALGNAPGVYSARYAGEQATDAENNAKLIRELKAHGCTSSPAFYACAMFFLDVDGTIIQTTGKCTGEIRLQSRGTGGFGYDPYFYILQGNEKGKTMAELSLAEKEAISHRGAALHAFVARLEAYWR